MVFGRRGVTEDCGVILFTHSCIIWVLHPNGMQTSLACLSDRNLKCQLVAKRFHLQWGFVDESFTPKQTKWPTEREPANYQVSILISCGDTYKIKSSNVCLVKTDPTLPSSRSGIFEVRSQVTERRGPRGRTITPQINFQPRDRNETYVYRL